MSEVWSDIPGWEGIYQASSLGAIRSLDRELPSGRWGHVRRRGEAIKPKVSANGYLVVGLRLNGERKWFGVHRLVCLAFHGTPPDGKPFATHFPDRDPLNCRADNLRWESAKQNSADRVMQGTHMAGDKNPAAKLSLANVEDIRRNYRPGRPRHIGNAGALAIRFGVSESCIKSAANGRTFKPDARAMRVFAS